MAAMESSGAGSGLFGFELPGGSPSSHPVSWGRTARWSRFPRQVQGLAELQSDVPNIEARSCLLWVKTFVP
eukprot:6042469-Karenia_brevis.AAC.1